MSESHYIHGTDPAEQRRLSTLNDLINDASLREMALSGGERILDVGSGLGQFTRAMARVAGRPGRVLGIEKDAQQLEQARRLAREAAEDDAVEFRPGDALALPLRTDEWGTFQVAHARFVLEHVPDPLGVVRQMVDAVRPGGRVILADDDHDILRLWPEPPGVGPLWQAYMRTYDRLGNDPYAGRRLVSLLHAAGARPTRNNWLFFGSCAGHGHFVPLIDNMIGILHGARASIERQQLLEPTLVDAGLDALETWKHRPDAALWFAICWAEGVKQ